MCNKTIWMAWTAGHNRCAQQTEYKGRTAEPELEPPGAVVSSSIDRCSVVHVLATVQTESRLHLGHAQ
jgi:hypothetical protein